MKKITYTVACAFAMLASSNAIAQQGFGTNRPHKSAAVHIESPNKGLLIPRVSLTSDTDNTTIVDPALSLLVYNTSSIGGLRPGYYYNSVEVNKTATPAIGPKWVPFLDASNNTVTAENGLTKVGNAIRLGGTIIDDTNITIDAGKKIMIQGLTQVTSMTDQVIAVGHYQSGHVQVATAEQIVTAGLTHDLTSVMNTMTSTINDKVDSADIINKNELTIEAIPNTTDVTKIDQVKLTSNVNDVTHFVDIKPAIQAGQVKYEVVSEDNSVVVTPDNTNPDFIKYDLKVTNTNASIEVGNGIKKDANDNNRVILGGDLTQPTTIATGTHEMFISDLEDAEVPKIQIGVKPNPVEGEDNNIYSNKIGNYKVMVVEDATGELREAHAGQIVNKGLLGGSAVTIDYDNSNGTSTINLGGKVVDRSEIITDEDNILAISGLVKNEVAYQNVVTVAANGNLQQTTLNTGVQITTKSADYGAEDNDETILVNTTTNDVAITIPAATTENKGKRFLIKSVGTDENHNNVLKISSASAIDGSTDPIESSSPYQSWLLQSNGSEWFVIGY